MLLSRRDVLSLAAAAAVPAYERPLFDLRRHLKSPVKIASIELLRNGHNHLVRTTSASGAAGVIQTKQIEEFIPIFHRIVVPAFLGRDARDVESLVDQVYTKNYKMAGQAFWCPVAYVEQSLWDLLGREAGKPAAELMGGIVRKEIPVYLSGSGRETTAEEEVDVYVRGVAETNATAVKFKIGGRMSRNADVYPGRTERMMTLARKRFGDAVVIYVDANGSYDSQKGIEVGRMLQDLRCAFYEEPCPWEELDETRRVADALDIPIAFGEQNSSLWQFQWIARNGVAQILQPDLNYNGGFVRAARVARIAREFNLPITPHNTQTDANGANILQFASCTPNIGPHMEWPYRGRPKPASWYTPNFEIVDGKIKVPTGPGLGVDFDPDYIKKSTLQLP
jgi:L-alanine-DL-glutamate epimerase-like enolase superfamily enzyme